MKEQLDRIKSQELEVARAIQKRLAREFKQEDRRKFSFNPVEDWFCPNTPTLRGNEARCKSPPHCEEHKNEELYAEKEGLSRFLMHRSSWRSELGLDPLLEYAVL